MADQKVYGPLTLPSGKEVFFRSPLGKDRTDALVDIDVTDDQFAKGNMLVERAVRAKCLVKVDGADPGVNPNRAFDDWGEQDINYYGEVFVQMFGMTEEKQKSAKEAAAFLLGNSTSSAGSNSTAESATTAG